MGSIGYGVNDWTPYQVPKIGLEDYDDNIKHTVDAVVGELVASDDFCWTVGVESSI